MKEKIKLYFAIVIVFVLSFFIVKINLELAELKKNQENFVSELNERMHAQEEKTGQMKSSIDVNRANINSVLDGLNDAELIKRCSEQIDRLIDEGYLIN